LKPPQKGALLAEDGFAAEILPENKDKVVCSRDSRIFEHQHSPLAIDGGSFARARTYSKGNNFAVLERVSGKANGMLEAYNNTQARRP
jgi:hypothetical protein